MIRFHRGLVIVLLVLFAGCARAPVKIPPPEPEPEPAPGEAERKILDFEATAYSIDGTTASGSTTRRGIVAADPAVLPLGSRIRVHDAGAYSGEYLVADTGPKVKGNEIDIYMQRQSEAVQFGRRRVRVEVLE